MKTSDRQSQVDANGRLPSKSTAPAKRIRITITTSLQVQHYLLALTESGLYGSTVAEAAERPISESLRNVMKRSLTASLEAKDE